MMVSASLSCARTSAGACSISAVMCFLISSCGEAAGSGGVGARSGWLAGRPAGWPAASDMVLGWAGRAGLAAGAIHTFSPSGILVAPV
jgi:hypothetical protein